MVVLRLLAINEDLSVEAVNPGYFAPSVVKQTINVVKLILLLSTIAPPRGQRLFNSCNVNINSPCLVRLVVFISNNQMLRCS